MKIYRYLALICSIAITGNIFTAYAENETKKEIEERIETNTEELENARKQAEITEQKINDKKEQLTEINMQLDDMEVSRLEKYNEIKLRIKYLYENGDTSLMETLLTSDGYTEALNKAELSSTIHDYDRQKLEEYEKLIEDIGKKQDVFYKDISELETLQEKSREIQRFLSEQIGQDEFKLLKINEKEKKEEEERRAVAAKRNSTIPQGTVVKNGNTWTYEQSDLEIMYAVVMQEGGSDYNSALAVMTCACNRAESLKWGYLGSDPLSQFVAPHQFCYTMGSAYKKYLNGNVPQSVINAVHDGLNGTRNHQHMSFRGYHVSGAECIGGNYYFA